MYHNAIPDLQLGSCAPSERITRYLSKYNFLELTHQIAEPHQAAHSQ